MTSQQQFIQNQLWISVIGAAFQRAKVYKPDASLDEKKVFKFKLRGFIENITNDYTNKSQINEDFHIDNILAISDFTKNFNTILSGGKLNFGVSQKLLNLYLKYQWCLGLITEPPHFPVDRIIQNKLRCPKIISWTSMDSPEQYMAIINHAKTQLTTELSSLAELELFLYENV